MRPFGPDPETRERSTPSARASLRTDGDPVAHLDLQVLDGAGGGRGDVHRRLVGLERDQRVLRLHRVAGFDEDLDDRDVREIADVRDLDLERAHRVSGFRQSTGRADSPRSRISGWPRRPWWPGARPRPLAP